MGQGLKQEVRLQGDYASTSTWSHRQKLTLACRHLAATGHESGLAGQITAREDNGELLAPPAHLTFAEMTASDFIRVDDTFNAVETANAPNPATRFHLWVYRARPSVQCIVHTHPPHVSALSMLGVPLVVAHMDATPFHEDCAFLAQWPGVPVADEEGEIIASALGEKRALLLAHHGLLVAGATIEEALYLADAMERAARLQILALKAGTIQPIPDDLAAEAHDFLLQPSIVSLTFDAHARAVIRSSQDCLD